MSTDAKGSAPAPQAIDNHDVKTEKKDQPKPQQPKDQQQQAAPSGEKKLSGAELKKKAKEEKAARRAQAKANQASQGPAQGGQQAAGGDGKGSKAKPKQDGHQQHGGAKLPIRPAGAVVAKDDKPSIPDCFSHLSMARRIEMTNADKDVHPAVLILGEHMSAFAISDSVTRLEATLFAFKKVNCCPDYCDGCSNSFRSLTLTQLLLASRSPAISHLTSSTPRSSISQHAAPCASLWATPSGG